MSSQYSWQQKVLCLIWLTYCISIPKTYFGSQEYLQTFATKAVKANFADPQIRSLIGTWQLTWGCAVYQIKKGSSSSNVNDHTMYIAKYMDNPDLDQYVIALAGTNPFSLQNLLLEDVNVATASPWNQGQPWKTAERLTKDNGEPAVSAGITKALKDLTTAMWDGDQLLFDHLREITMNASKPVEITVAGHSLAGAMAPSLALSLVDRQAEWDAKQTTNIKVVSLAGFSPGNEAFARYYDQMLGEKTERLWNQMDIVPNVWAVEGLRKIPRIYTPDIPPILAVDIALKALELSSQDQNYTHIKRTTEGFASDFNPGFMIDNLPNDPDLKGVVLDVCTEFMAYPVILQLQSIPLVGDVTKDYVTDLVKEFSEEVRVVLDDVVTNSASSEDLLKESLNGVISKICGVDVNLFLFPIPDELEELLSTRQVVRLINFVLQVLFQHVWRYSRHYQFTEFDARRAELTAQVASKMKVEESKVQTQNTVIVNYGSAKKDDVDDLLRGEGKLLRSISSVMEQLKQADQVSQNAQPVIFIVQKKKDSGKF